MKTYFLKSERIGFSVWEAEDIDLAFSLWGQSEVTKYISATGVFTDGQIKNRLKTEIENYKKHKVQYFPIFSLETNDLIGCCGLKPYKNTDNIYELGFHLRKEYWQKGYGFESASKMIEYAFYTLNAEELKAGHNPNNIASKNLLIKLGFQYECDEFYEPTGLYHPLYNLKIKTICKNEK